jgi:hypothetical protein
MPMPNHSPHPSPTDRGSALIIALIATVLLTSLGVGLVMLSNTEGAIAANYRAGNETLYAGFVDNTLTPTTPYGESLDLTAMTAEVQYQSDATAPWGPNNPQWHLFAYGPLSDMLGPGGVQSNTYISVWISDDPSETDNNPSADTNGVVTVLAQALGANGTRRSIEVTIAKTDSSEIERGQIAQRGQEELNQRARKAAVELPGKSLTVMDMNTSTGGMAVR